MSDTISSPVLLVNSTYELLASMAWVEHFSDTVRRLFFGFAITVVLGTIVGIVMGLSDFWKKALQDYVIFGLSLPSLFAAIFAAMYFGISDITPIAAVVVIGTPFMTQVIYEGVEDVDHRLIEMSNAFNVSRRRILKRVVIRAAMPEWFTGVRYTFAGAWKITTLAELFAATSGVGFMIQYEFRVLDLTGVLTWTVLFTVFILVFEYGVLHQIEKRLFAWKQQTTAAAMA